MKVSIYSLQNYPTNKYSDLGDGGLAQLINVNETCGKNKVTRGDGEVIRNLIIAYWDQSAKIRLDFGNILVASVSFLDEAIGKLAMTYTRQELASKIGFLNIQEFDRALVNDILLKRYRAKEMA